MGLPLPKPPQVLPRNEGVGATQMEESWLLPGNNTSMINQVDPTVTPSILPDIAVDAPIIHGKTCLIPESQLSMLFEASPSLRATEARLVVESWLSARILPQPSQPTGRVSHLLRFPISRTSNLGIPTTFLPSVHHHYQATCKCHHHVRHQSLDHLYPQPRRD